MKSPVRRFLACRALVLACWYAPLTFAASPASSVLAPGEKLEELGEVIVRGLIPTRKVADMIPWLRRILGQYTIDGYVELGGRGGPDHRRHVHGSGICIGFGVAPGVQCEINVRGQEGRGADGAEILGGVSPLSPAMMLYGLEPDEVGIRYLQVDNRGLAEGATGGLIGDMVTFRAPCAELPDACQRITRITARSDSKVIDMQVDTELNYDLTMRYRLQFTRIAEVQAAPAAHGGTRP